MCKSTETLREPSDGKHVIWEEKNFISMISRSLANVLRFPKKLCVERKTGDGNDNRFEQKLYCKVSLGNAKALTEFFLSCHFFLPLVVL